MIRSCYEMLLSLLKMPEMFKFVIFDAGRPRKD